MYCDRCDMENCADHGPHRALAAQRRAQALSDAEIQVSPTNTAHFVGCAHKGDDEDFSRWGFTRGTKDAWTRLGNGEQVPTTHGEARVATSAVGTASTAVQSQQPESSSTPTVSPDQQASRTLSRPAALPDRVGSIRRTTGSEVQTIAKTAR